MCVDEPPAFRSATHATDAPAGQREAARTSGLYAHGDDGGDSSGSEAGSGSGGSKDDCDGGSDGAVASQRAGRSVGSSEDAAEEDPSYGEAPGSGCSGGSPPELSLEDIQVHFSCAASL
jgi:hypothetical protein